MTESNVFFKFGDPRGGFPRGARGGVEYASCIMCMLLRNAISGEFAFDLYFEKFRGIAFFNIFEMF